MRCLSNSGDGDGDGGLNSDWLATNAARTCRYKFRSKVTQNGKQATKHGDKLDTSEKEKPTFVTAEVAIKTSAKTHGSASQGRRLEAEEVFMLTQDQKGAGSSVLEDVDLPYYFSQDVMTGAVTNLHHDPAEKYFILHQDEIVGCTTLG